MQGRLVALGRAVDWRAAPGGHVPDASIETTLTGLPVDSAIQTSGSVTGMLIAGVLVIALGLTAVAVWQGYVSTLLERTRGSSESAEEGAAGSADDIAETDRPNSAATEEAPPEAVELSDRERVVDILEDHDGRMKQASIVDATGWSKSKVSMLLSEMEDEGDITKLRVGRENIISLRGNEPDAAGSPFDSQ